MSETEIQKSICDYLAYRRHFFWRQNSAPSVYSKDGQMQFRRMPKYGMNGVPDLILIKDGIFIGLEVKGPKGRQSPDQKEFETRCRESGGLYYVVRSIDDVIAIGL